MEGLSYMLKEFPDICSLSINYARGVSCARPEFIAKGGWDKMPGQKDACVGVSQACAEGLQALVSMK